MLKSMIIYLMLMIPMVINMILISLIMFPFKSYKFHPLSLLLILILMIFLISNKMNFLSYTWMSFILFLSMIGGLMVIYMYITSISNNEFFYLNIIYFIIMLLKISPIIFLLMLIYNFFPLNYYMNFNIQNTWNINLFLNMYDKLNLNTIFNKINNKSTLFIMMYLYYSMVCIMNICFKFKIPLRQLIY